MLVTGFPLSSVAPQVRQQLSAAALFRLVRSRFAALPDHRLDETEISFTDALMSAVALFSRTAPSRLAFDQERAEGHWHTIDGMERVPCDTHLRALLDPVSPQVCRPVFKSVLRPLQRGQALAPLVFLAGPD